MSGYYAFLFAAAALRGARTRVLLDAHPGANSTTVARLARTGAVCRLLPAAAGGRRVAGHWKLLIADHCRIAVGSGNLIKRDAPRQSSLPGTREWWASVDGSTRLAGVAADGFESAWSTSVAPPRAWERRAPPAAPAIGIPRPVVAPRTVVVPDRALSLHLGGTAAAAAAAELLASARRSVALTVPYIHCGAAGVGDLLTALMVAGARGAAVAVLLGAVPQPRDALALAALPLDVRVMDPIRSTTGHAKGLVVDGRVLVGSANWSSAGMGANREAALLIDHPSAAEYYGAAFWRDWRVALRLGSARLARRTRGYAGQGHGARLVEAR